MAKNYRIGAVARLTGIAAETLRMWERRYEVVKPQRSGNQRLYSQDDITRLSLLKALVDAGHGIGTVATLADAELRDRLAREQGRQQEQPPLRVAVAGSRLCGDIDLGRLGANSEVVLLAQNRNELVNRAAETHIDVIVLELPSLQQELVSEVLDLRQACRAAHAVVVYDFAAHVTLERLAARHIGTLSFPASKSQIGIIAETTAGLSKKPEPVTFIAAPPSRRYSEEELVQIRNTPTGVQCECPLHLTELIMKLAAFEQYSMECESLDANDAALHAYLYQCAAQARSSMESALAKVIEVDDLALAANNS